MLVKVERIEKQEVTVVSSLDVAETFEKRHDHVLRDVECLRKDIPNFGEMFFETSVPDSYSRERKVYYMNRDGFTLLVMGYTGEKAMKFKLAYIKQFNAMEKVLQGKFVEREKGIAVRQSLTKAIQQSTEDLRMHGHAYSTYTNCIYKVLFGVNAKQMREALGIGAKENIRDYLSEEQLREVQAMEYLVSGLVACGWDYDKVKSFIEQNNTRLIAC